MILHDNYQALLSQDTVYNDRASVHARIHNLWSFSICLFKNAKEGDHNVLAKASKTTWSSMRSFALLIRMDTVWTDNRQVTRLKDSSLEEWARRNPRVQSRSCTVGAQYVAVVDWKSHDNLRRYITILLKRNRHHNILRYQGRRCTKIWCCGCDVEEFGIVSK